MTVSSTQGPAIAFLLAAVGIHGKAHKSIDEEVGELLLKAGAVVGLHALLNVALAGES